MINSGLKNGQRNSGFKVNATVNNLGEILGKLFGGI
jgi:hypothetical protein